jgi:hypothetical protein
MITAVADAVDTLVDNEVVFFIGSNIDDVVIGAGRVDGVVDNEVVVSNDAVNNEGGGSAAGFVRGVICDVSVIAADMVVDSTVDDVAHVSILLIVSNALLLCSTQNLCTCFLPCMNEI